MKVKTHTFNLTPQNNGGEAIILKTKLTGKDGGVQGEQELILQSYGNSASFNLGSILFTPDVLRKLANELEKETIKFVCGSENGDYVELERM
jgi:hypothetical protein